MKQKMKELITKILFHSYIVICTGSCLLIIVQSLSGYSYIKDIVQYDLTSFFYFGLASYIGHIVVSLVMIVLLFKFLMKHRTISKDVMKEDFHNVYFNISSLASFSSFLCFLPIITIVMTSSFNFVSNMDYLGEIELDSNTIEYIESHFNCCMVTEENNNEMRKCKDCMEVFGRKMKEVKTIIKVLHAIISVTSGILYLCCLHYRKIFLQTVTIEKRID